jgi:hypothetical protein
MPSQTGKKSKKKSERSKKQAEELGQAEEPRQTEEQEKRMDPTGSVRTTLLTFS